jgi:hypothetical protein
MTEGLHQEGRTVRTFGGRAVSYPGYTLAIAMDCARMMNRLVLAAFLLGGAPAPSEAKPGSDPKREIAWARAKWTRDLKGLQFDAPVDKLLNWLLPGTSTSVWAFSPMHRCARLDLIRAGRTQTTAGDDEDELEGKEILEQRVVQGREVRTYRLFSFGFLFSGNGDELGSEERDRGGTWHPAGSGGTGSRSVPFGALSYVDAEVARFGGTAVVLHPECVGPVRWLKCTGGGERPCVGCEQTDVLVIDANDYEYFSEGGLFSPDRPVTCTERCPANPVNPALARLSDLQEHAHVWRQSGKSPAEAPSLHRSFEGCMRAHFPAGIPTSRR